MINKLLVPLCVCLALLLWPTGASMAVEPCLNVAITAAPNPVASGSPVTITYSITNCGSDTLRNLETTLGVYNECNNYEVYDRYVYEQQSRIRLEPGQTLTVERIVIPPIPTVCGSQYAYILVGKAGATITDARTEFYVLH